MLADKGTEYYLSGRIPGGYLSHFGSLFIESGRKNSIFLIGAEKDIQFLEQSSLGLRDLSKIWALAHLTFV